MEDLKIARRKYTREALFPADANSTRRPGSVTNFEGVITNENQTFLLVGANDTRTALRFAITPTLVFNNETTQWDQQAAACIIFPVPNGTVDPFTIDGPIYPISVLSSTTKLFDTLRIEEFGTLIYGSFCMMYFSSTPNNAIQVMTATDIMADRVVMAGAQGETVRLEG